MPQSVSVLNTSAGSRAQEPATATGGIPLAEIAVDTEELTSLLLGKWPKERLASRALAADPDFQNVEGLSMAEHRARVFDQLHKLVEHRAIHRAFPIEVGGEDNQGGHLAAFEELVIADPSLQIKAGVQWGLFGAAIMHLGTKGHHRRWLPGVLSLEIPGAFAMTETGHGSDVSSIGTTATYDPSMQEFVIHTPFRGAWKDYLGNAAQHGIAAVVFAQLITSGENHGVHAFYVPIRGEDGAFLPGVGGEDDGLKGGLNGIDNGRLHFDQVRIPRQNLLNRYGDVAPDGSYSSPIHSQGRRFFTMLGTLVQGRVSLNGSAIAASKVSLEIAIRYALERRQFSPDGSRNEQVLLDYQRHQRRLIPLLATTYAASFAHEQLLESFDTVFSGANEGDEARADLETLAAALKASSTWHALGTLQECREACGGAGFLTQNRFTSLRSDLDIYATFEGDNNVLLQLVGKRLLKDYAKKFSGSDLSTITSFAAEQAADHAFSRSGLRRMAQTVSDFGSTARSVEHLRDTDTQHRLLADRVETMIGEIARSLKAARGLPPQEAALVFNDHQDALIQVAKAHAELLQWEAFTSGIAQVRDAGTRQVLTWLRDVYGFGLIEQHASWYLMYGRISPQRASSVTAYLNRLIERVRPHALDLVVSFGYQQEHLRAEIASGAEARRQQEARDHYRV